MTDQKIAELGAPAPPHSEALALRLVSVRKPALPGAASRAVALAMRVVAAGLLVLIGWIHWHLWSEGYKYIPTNGPFFLIDAISAIVLAAALLAWARPLIGLLAAGFLAGTIGALVISLQFGLFGFQESMHASFVVESLVIESLALVIVAAWTVLAAWRRPPD